jgi:hypothetical protein
MPPQARETQKPQHSWNKVPQTLDGTRTYWKPRPPNTVSSLTHPTPGSGVFTKPGCVIQGEVSITGIRTLSVIAINSSQESHITCLFIPLWTKCIQAFFSGLQNANNPIILK